MKYITCKICGERVQSKSSMKQYCAECLRERRNALRREYAREWRERNKYKDNPNGAILKDVRDAIKAGVSSYGKYKAMQRDTAYIEEKARERRRKNNLNNQKEKRGEK